jgi:hypothetical protein
MIKDLDMLKSRAITMQDRTVKSSRMKAGKKETINRVNIGEDDQISRWQTAWYITGTGKMNHSTKMTN